MIHRANHPVEPWAFVEEGVDLERLAQTESLFALSNGHIGLRGNLDEGEPRGLSGTYLNGFYESFPLEYGERGYGFAEDGQTVVNVTDGKIIRLQVEDEPLDVHRGEVQHHVRRLDFRSGLLERELIWRAASGHVVKLTTKRLVSLSMRSLAAIEYEVEAVEEPIRIAIQSNLQANTSEVAAADDPRRGRSLGDALDLAPLHRRRHARGARARDQALGADDGLGHGPRRRARRRGDRADPVRAGPRARDPVRRAGARQAAAAGQAALLPLVLAAERRLAARSGRRQPRERAGRGLRRAGGGPALASGRLLEARQRRGRGRPRAAAGAALRDVPPLPGRRARRGPRDPREGTDRHRLRRPRLLGHRELRAADPDLHRARDRARRARVAPLDARQSARAARPAAAPGWRRAALAHDPRRGVLGLLARRHGRLPRQRRGRPRGQPLRGRDRRPRVRASRPAASCWSRARACGAASATTTSRASSASTGSPAPTSTRRWSTTTSTPT